MDRRQLLRQFVVISGGLLLMPSCGTSADPEELLKTFIPQIIPGIDGGASAFIMRMADDCLPKANRDQFYAGLKKFARRNENLESLHAGTPDDEDISFFYKTVKSLSIQYYTNSQSYMTKVRVYELAPARYVGCAPVNSSTKKTF